MTTPRLSASTITDDQLDALYDQLDRVRALADRIDAGAPWAANHTDLAARIRGALDTRCACTYGERCPNCRD